MTIVLAGVGGLIFTVVVIGMCVTCRYRRGKKNTRLQKQDSLKRNALEMAVSDSTNTAYQLAKQNNQNYYSLPRPSGHATMMNHRGSFSKVPSEGDYGDHLSDTSTYKKFLQLEQNIDEDSSRCPSPYISSPGFTTIIEQHPMPPGMTPDLGWGYQGQMEPPTSPTLAENLSKLQQYNQYTNMLQNQKGIPVITDDQGSMTMEFRYDPSIPVYPATKFRIKSPETKYGWGTEPKTSTPAGKNLTFKNQDADTAPDLTREIETT